MPVRQEFAPLVSLRVRCRCGRQNRHAGGALRFPFWGARRTQPSALVSVTRVLPMGASESVCAARQAVADAARQKQACRIGGRCPEQHFQAVLLAGLGRQHRGRPRGRRGRPVEKNYLKTLSVPPISQRPWQAPEALAGSAGSQTLGQPATEVAGTPAPQLLKSKTTGGYPPLPPRRVAFRRPKQKKTRKKRSPFGWPGRPSFFALVAKTATRRLRPLGRPARFGPLAGLRLPSHPGEIGSLFGRRFSAGLLRAILPPWKPGVRLACLPRLYDAPAALRAGNRALHGPRRGGASVRGCRGILRGDWGSSFSRSYL